MSISIRHITKRFDDFVALDDVSVDVGKGSLTALLGPSGSGKSTLLRIVAGLEAADHGAVFIDGQDVTARPPQKRGVGFVFQHYAAFKHMTVHDNVAFGLAIRKRPKAEIAERVNQLLRLVQLEGLAKRYPSQLSGGQRQRMGLARALAIDPAVLLLDEPFGALDARVRAELRDWLRRLHDETHTTTVIVTHDQEEAMEVADQVAVMSDGRIEQVGPPQDVYEEPTTTFVADFLGVSNLMAVTAHGESNRRCKVALGEFELFASNGDVSTTGETRMVIRPERVHLEAHESTGENRIPGMVERVVYLGNANQIIIRLAHGETIHALVQNTGAQLAYRQGDPVKAYMPAEALRVLTDTGTAPLEDDPRALPPAHPVEPVAEEASASNVNV
jgi:sulfate ABC transporter ATP-binding protein